MSLKSYFESHKGTGVLATADADGRVDAAIYARPHFDDDGNLVFIMRDRLTHHNLQSNPHATYLFIEDGRGYRGKRLFMTKVAEEENETLATELSRRKYVSEDRDLPETRFVVTFQLDRELPLVGSGEK